MKFYRKYLVIGIIILFVVASVIPVISGYQKNKDEDNLQINDILEKLLHRDGIKDFYPGSTNLVQQSYLEPPNILWNKTFGGSYSDAGCKIRKTTDDGFIILGDTDEDFWLIKIDENGDEVWSNSYGNPVLYEYVMDVQQTSDGGYIIVGYFFFFQELDPGILLVKTNSDGEELWNNTFGTIFQPADAFSVYQTADGGYLIFGNDWENDDGLYLIKTDGNGDLMWEKNVVGSGDCLYSFSSAETDDGGYVVTGFVGVGYDIDMFVMKIDSDHDKQWFTTKGGELYDCGLSIIQADNGKYVVAGFKDSIDDYLNGDVWIVQFDDQGDEDWNNVIEGDVPEIPYSIQETNSGYVVVGTSMSSTIGAHDMFVIITDGNGNVIEKWILGGSSYDEGYYVYVTSEYDYIITGYTNSYGTQGSSDLWLLKIEGLIVNLPPDAPVIDGPTKGRRGRYYIWSFTITDPNDDDIYLYVDWGNGQNVEWDGPHESGKMVNLSYRYDYDGDYSIRAKAKDKFDNVGHWSDFKVNIPKNKPSNYNFKILDWFLERLPFIERLLMLFRAT